MTYLSSSWCNGERLLNLSLGSPLPLAEVNGCVQRGCRSLGGVSLEPGQQSSEEAAMLDCVSGRLRTYLHKHLNYLKGEFYCCFDHSS